MTPYLQPFTQFLNARRIPFEWLDEHAVRITYRGRQMANIPFICLFDDEGDNTVQLFCNTIARFNDDNFIAGVAECNDCNINYKFIRFYMDNSMDVVVNYDMKLRHPGFGDEIIEMLNIMAEIIDTVHPDFMKAMWG
ncbi:MAG: YbjN domain-containing protein [Oscillospiraceae bacterium]|nr:YbjN domain-containing protein [Oscillospiraceae bacterium]